jgi:hypothetical protein
MLHYVVGTPIPFLPTGPASYFPGYACTHPARGIYPGAPKYLRWRILKVFYTRVVCLVLLPTHECTS